MNFLMESIEHEMGEAFEVKNRDSLRRCALLLAENMVTRAEYTAETGTIHEDIREILTEMRVRFDASDKKFEMLHEEMNSRFDASDKKFEMLHEEMNSRFDASDKKFEILHEEMNSRFDAGDKRFEQMFRFQTLTVTILALLITVFNFL